jgi:hypothetical protein
MLILYDLQVLAWFTAMDRKIGRRHAGKTVLALIAD